MGRNGNSLSDLNAHLFAQLERLDLENLTADDIAREAARTESIVKLADAITDNARTQLAAAKLFHEAGKGVLPMLPQVGPKAIEAAE